jgi:hypothetical protein
MWISAARPGKSGEITTARYNNICGKLRDAGLGALCDRAFIGLDDDPENPVIITGFKGSKNKPLTDVQKQVNQLVSAERAPNEHGFADLKNWRILTRLRMNTTHGTQLLRALQVLVSHEITR